MSSRSSMTPSSLNKHQSTIFPPQTFDKAHAEMTFDSRDQLINALTKQNKDIRAENAALHSELDDLRTEYLSVIGKMCSRNDAPQSDLLIKQARIEQLESTSDALMERVRDRYKNWMACEAQLDVFCKKRGEAELKVLELKDELEEMTEWIDYAYEQWNTLEDKSLELYKEVEELEKAKLKLVVEREEMLEERAMNEESCERLEKNCTELAQKIEVMEKKSHLKGHNIIQMVRDMGYEREETEKKRQEMAKDRKEIEKERQELNCAGKIEHEDKYEVVAGGETN
ncbi:hypothetical protein M011DRAFT_482052 [Sporormia fimetaria CBS 119925]|uniref:Uncharacterized protein n=1 Tax=Sporormia fimetaria CBS 119925 TaxID=1340428 RepID=A0A6A6UWX5_9PLEO|nr:hypothetical protein M011DRAFT_482052 [Sporormia fimetaria CBS 119925]